MHGNVKSSIIIGNLWPRSYMLIQSIIKEYFNMTCNPFKVVYSYSRLRFGHLGSLLYSTITKSSQLAILWVLLFQFKHIVYSYCVCLCYYLKWHSWWKLDTTKDMDVWKICQLRVIQKSLDCTYQLIYDNYISSTWYTCTAKPKLK